MNHKKKFQNVVDKIILIWIVLLAVVLGMFYIPKTSFYYEELPRLEEWEISGAADVVTTLPEEFQENRIVCFWSNHQKIQVYLDDQMIDLNGSKEELSFSEIETSRWNRVEIPKNSAGKKLRIHSESGSRPFVTEFVFGSNEKINQWIHQHYGNTQLLDVGMTGIGFFFVVFGILNTRKSAIRYQPLYLGQAMILTGIFLRVGLKGIPIHWMSEYTKDLLTYLTFLGMTFPMFIYLSKRNMSKGVYAYFCHGLALLQILCVGIVFLMHGLEILDITSVVWLGAVFWLLLSVLAFFGAVKIFVKKRSWATSLALLSAVLLVLIVPLEIARTYFFSDYVREYGTIFRGCFMLLVMSEAFDYSINLQKMETQKERTEEENRKLQFQLLSSQIRPHFILNTLGAIRSMVMEDANRASDLLYDFSMYLRKNIEEKDYMKPIPFGEELDYIETYLRLEQTRFGERLNVKYQIEEKEFWVLPLTIQPFVENAVKHGLFPKKNGGTLKISTYRKGNQIMIEILDDGVGFETENLQTILEEKKSVGLRSAIYRMESEMGGKCSIISQEQGIQGTFVRIILPQ